MKKYLFKLVQITGAWNYKKHKARLLHPVGFCVFLLIFPIALVVCIFSSDDLIYAIKSNFTLL